MHYLLKFLFFFLFAASTQCIALESASTGWTDGFVDSDGVKIHYLEKKRSAEMGQTTSPTLLFIPGLSMPGWVFEKQLQYFSQNYSVVAMDPRSQGDSTQTSEGHYAAARAKDIKAVVDQLELQPVVLIGWSLAVSEIVAYLDQFGSDGISGVVLTEGLAGMEPGSEVQNLMIKYWSDFQKNRPKNTPNFVNWLFKQPQNEEFLERLASASLRTPTNTLMTLAYNCILQDFRSALPKINVPTLIITITSARPSWIEGVGEMHRLIPNSRLEIIENAGHAVFVDQPEQFNCILEEFLSTSLFLN